MKREMDELEDRKAWSLFPMSDVTSGETIAQGNWVYVEKDRPNDPNDDHDGILRKSRWVVNGNELADFSREKTFAPVVSHSTNRILLALGVQHKWVNLQEDVVVAL